MRGIVIVSCLLLAVAFVEAKPSFPWPSRKKCGYDRCTDAVPDKLNVHIVAHTHDDVGWLKTVDQYYYGHRNTIQKAGVQYIIDSVVTELLRDKSRRFIYVESAFFSKWWDEQTEEMKKDVKKLVDEGRLEFIGGAWSMNDEAAVHYHSVIDQFSYGLKFLNDTFGTCGRPHIGWQIDPFGHSREQASMFAQMGYDGMFFARLDYQDKNNRMKTKTPEMIWHGSENLSPDQSDILTSVLYNHYSPPPGFCWDLLCNDDPIIDDPHSFDYNVPEKMKAFVDFAKKAASNYRTNNILITMGDDFSYQDANMWFKNIDKLLTYANDLYGDEVNIFYSTPTCYLKSLHDANITWSEKSDDFFPYANDPYTYWTGYYTSRPTQKRYERVGNNFLQVCKQVTAIAPSQEPEYEENLKELQSTIGVMQHHDAITGTEKQHVADDYARMLHQAFEACESNIRNVFNDMNDDVLNYENCLHLNVSACEVTEASETTYLVTLYNPTGQTKQEFVRVPMSNDKYLVVDVANDPLEYQIVPIPESVLNIKERKSSATHEIVFRTPEIPPMGIAHAFLIFNDNDDINRYYWKKPAAGEGFSIKNEFIELKFDSNGLVSHFESGDFSESFAQNFVWYEGANGDNREFKNRSSGAYIFRPNNTERLLTQRVKVEVVDGPLVQEVHQIFNDWVSQVIRVYRGQSHVEFEWLAGPIPFKDGLGKELVSRFYTKIKSDGVFYTDSNGREMLKRVRNHRDTWNVEIYEKEAGNYYPVTSKIAIEDEEHRLAVLNDRAQGGSSLFDGVVELMVHRRLLRDDAFGVGEALNETTVARGRHYVFFGPKKGQEPSQVAKERLLQSDLITNVWPMFADIRSILEEKSLEEIQAQLNEVSFMATSLPDNVKLLTFEPLNFNDTFLLRLEHIFEFGEDPWYSKPVEVNLLEVFDQFDFTLRETTLDGNQWLDETVRLKFNTDSEGAKKERFQKIEKANYDNYVIMLTPMEIRTFVMTIVGNSTM